MDHHFQAPLAEAKGVSTSSAKPETLAVQYWTISERKAPGLCWLFLAPGMIYSGCQANRLNLERNFAD
jgi:hypothetical protein